MIGRKRKDAGHRDVLVIGNGMVGHHFVRKLRERDPDGKRFGVTILGAESLPAYDRVNLTKLMSLGTPEKLLLAKREWYAENQVDLHLSTRAESVDPAAKTVLAGGESYSYDELVIATGSTPFVPPVPGIGHSEVFTYRTTEDLQNIQTRAASAKRAVVIGGGLLGLEAAKALFDEGVAEVHVVEMASFLMPQQLDEQAGLILKREMEHLGLVVHLGRRLTEVVSADAVLELQFLDHRPLQADMVVVSAGIRATTSFLDDSGLKLNPRGGVEVNDQLCASIDNVYAIGECAVHRGIAYGLVKPGYQMAETLVRHLVGRKASFESADVSTRLKIASVNVGVYGDVLLADPKSRAETYFELDGPNNNYRKLVIRDRRLTGIMAVGRWDELALLQSVMDQGRRLRDKELANFAKTGRLWPNRPLAQSVATWPDVAKVCNCMNVSNGDLIAAMDDGCLSFEGICERTGAASVCGSCTPLVETLVDGAPTSVPAITCAARVLFGLSAATLVIGLTLLLYPGVELVNSVEAMQWRIEQLWRDTFYKQVSGFTLLGITLIALLLSLRKRLKSWRKLGSFGSWRALHGTIGLLTLLMLFVHTGFHLGSNLNRMLMVTFALLNLLGALVGIAAGLESKPTPLGMLCRRIRPFVTVIHLALFWPLPALIGAHVFTVYYY